jgi:hypothetical protein
MGRLERHLDTGLTRRVLTGIKSPPEPLKQVKPHRDLGTYRAARRNAVRENQHSALLAKRRRRMAA